jgi:hypothetical protein
LARANRQGLLMQPRLLLVLLLVAATALLVVGVSVEKSSGDTHEESGAAATEQASGDEHAEESGEGAESGEEGESGEASEAGEAGGGHAESAAGQASEEDETLLGTDLEATGFVALAAVVSLALALALWLRPGWAQLLAVVVVVMVAFAALDVREVFHQIDEDDGGLALLAGVVAALHLVAAGVALLMRRLSSSPAGDAAA